MFQVKKNHGNHPKVFDWTVMNSCDDMPVIKGLPDVPEYFKKTDFHDLVLRFLQGEITNFQIWELFFYSSDIAWNTYFGVINGVRV